MNQRSQSEDHAKKRSANPLATLSVVHPDPPCEHHGESRERLAHHQSGVHDEAWIERGDEPRETCSCGRELVASEPMNEERHQCTGNGIEHRGDVRARAENSVNRGKRAAVAHGPVAPRMPSDGAVGIAEPGGNAPRPEVVVVPVPHRFARPRDGDVEPGAQCYDEQRCREERSRGGGGAAARRETSSTRALYQVASRKGENLAHPLEVGARYLRRIEAQAFGELLHEAAGVHERGELFERVLFDGPQVRRARSSSWTRCR